MQLNKKFHVIDTENGRLLKGFDSGVEASEFADAQAMANQTKMFAVMQVVNYATVETKVKVLNTTDFQEEEEHAESN